MVADVVVAVLLLSGCSLFLVAAVGAVRFPDVLTRMHATTKAATIGLVLLLAAAAVGIDSAAARSLLALVAVFQFLTAPRGGPHDRARRLPRGGVRRRGPGGGRPRGGRGRRSGAAGAARPLSSLEERQEEAPPPLTAHRLLPLVVAAAVACSS